jgi:hypothetical protein
MVRNSQQYVTLENYQDNSVLPISATLEWREGYSLEPDSQHYDYTPRRGVGIDALQEYFEAATMYDEDEPYLYLSTPLFARYPFGPDYNLPVSPRYLDTFPSFPSCDSSTRVYYND